MGSKMVKMPHVCQQVQQVLINITKNGKFEFCSFDLFMFVHRISLYFTVFMLESVTF